MKFGYARVSTQDQSLSLQLDALDHYGVDETFEAKGIHFVSIQDRIDTITAMGRFFFRMLASIAELERDIISERTKDGLTAARARGRNGGRPKVDLKKIELAIKMYESKDYSLSQIKTATGIGATTLYRYLEKKKISSKEV